MSDNCPKVSSGGFTVFPFFRGLGTKKALFSNWSSLLSVSSGFRSRLRLHLKKSVSGLFLYTVYYIHPLQYKRTGDISISPVHQKKILVARPVFRAKICRPSSFSPMFFLKKLSPVLKNTKKLSAVISRPSCPAPKLVARPVFRPSFYTGRGVYNIRHGVAATSCTKKFGSIPDTWKLIHFLN